MWRSQEKETGGEVGRRQDNAKYNAGGRREAGKKEGVGGGGPAGSLAGVHEVTEAGELVLGGQAAVADLPELHHALRLFDHVLRSLPQLEAPCTPSSPSTPFLLCLSWHPPPGRLTCRTTTCPQQGAQRQICPPRASPRPLTAQMAPRAAS